MRYRLSSHRLPLAHLPLVLGVLRRLDVATVIDNLVPPHPAQVLSGGRGVEALLLAMHDGHHALYKVGSRLEERGMLPLLQPGLQRPSLNDYRLEQMPRFSILYHALPPGYHRLPYKLSPKLWPN